MFGRVALVLIGAQVATGLLAVALSAYFAGDRSRVLAGNSLRLRLDVVAEEIEQRTDSLRALDALPPLVRADLADRFPDPVFLVDYDGIVVDRFVPDSLFTPLPLPDGLDTLLAAGEVVVHANADAPAGTWGVAPIYDADGLLAGGLVVQPLTLSLAAELEPTQSAFRRALLVAGAGALALALLLGALFTRRLVRPLRRITRGVEKIGAGDYAARLDETGDDEITRLAHAVNTMAAQVAQSVETLRAADVLRRELVANVGHDLRTPLAALHGYAEEAERLLHAHRTDEAAQALASARRQATHLTRMVADLFELSVLEGGSIPLRREPVPVGELLHAAADAHRALLRDAGITFAVDIPPGLPVLDADGVRLLRLLDNLLANARQHTPSGGTIALSARADDESVVVRVRDTGRGIPADVLPHVFERYYRGSEARTRGEGTGLGLSIAASVARAHGGRLTAESTLGEGSTFTLHLPLT